MPEKAHIAEVNRLILGCARLPEISQNSIGEGRVDTSSPAGEAILTWAGITSWPEYPAPQNILGCGQRAYLQKLARYSSPAWLASRMAVRLLAWRLKKEKILTDKRNLPVFASGHRPCFAHAEDFVFCGWLELEEKAPIGIDVEKVFSTENAHASRKFLEKFLPQNFFGNNISPARICRLWTVAEALYKYLDDEKIFLEIFPQAATACRAKSGCFLEHLSMSINSWPCMGHWLTAVFPVGVRPKMEWHFLSWEALISRKDACS